jgi:hypothetical protein
MTAAAPNSTPTPEIPFDWRELWDSASRLHPDAPEALHHAITAGVDPRDLRLIQLAGDDAPAFWFGPRGGVCTIYDRGGVAGTAIVGKIG